MPSKWLRLGETLPSREENSWVFLRKQQRGVKDVDHVSSYFQKNMVLTLDYHVINDYYMMIMVDILDE